MTDLQIQDISPYKDPTMFSCTTSISIMKIRQSPDLLILTMGILLPLRRYNYSISQEICTRFVVLCFVMVMQSFIMNSHEVFIYIHQGCFAGTGAIVRLPQYQWSKPDGYGKISECITTTKHSKAKTVCIFIGIYCILSMPPIADLKWVHAHFIFCLNFLKSLLQRHVIFSWNNVSFPNVSIRLPFDFWQWF